MAGHNKWAQIKHQKGVTDSKRAQLFSKLLGGISIAARSGADPKFNPKLRAAIEKAKEHNVPHVNIERAIIRANESVTQGEELIFEAYGPHGTALIIQVTTDNKNRTVAEVKKTLRDHDAKWAETGSVRWAFDFNVEKKSWTPKFFHHTPQEEVRALNKLIHDLKENFEIQEVWHN